MKIISPTGTTLFTTERVANLLLEGGYSLPETKRKTTRKTTRKTASKAKPKEEDKSSKPVTEDDTPDDGEK